MVLFADLHRTFPNNSFFKNIQGDALRNQLEELLRALSQRWPDIGYCQGLNYIAALLLIVTQSPEDAFWLMDVSLEHLQGYYAADMAGVRCDLQVLQRLLE